MVDAETIPETARLHREKHGVKWYIDGGGVNVLHFMEFEGRILAGSWVGPRWVFLALTSLPPEERMRYCTHDACMGAITLRLAQLQRAGNQEDLLHTIDT